MAPAIGEGNLAEVRHVRLTGLDVIVGVGTPGLPPGASAA